MGQSRYPFQDRSLQLLGCQSLFRHLKILNVLTNEGAATYTANQDECNQDTYIVRSDVEEETSC